MESNGSSPCGSIRHPRVSDHLLKTEDVASKALQLRGKAPMMKILLMRESPAWLTAFGRPSARAVIRVSRGAARP